MSADTAAFRAELRPRLPRWYRGWPHFALTNALLGGLTVWLAAHVRAARPAEWLAVPAAFLVANLVEYVAHRNPLHRPMPRLRYIYKAHTLQHHRFFTGDTPAHMACDSSRDFAVILFGPVSQASFVVGLGLPISLALGAALSPNVGWLFGATATAYFLTYEWLHLLYHLPSTNPLTRLPGLAVLQRHHLRHHELRLMSKYNFNITFPIFDLLLQTRFRPGPAGLPRATRADTVARP